jgi:hypothetical protein
MKRYKINKLLFYAWNFLQAPVPRFFFTSRLQSRLRELEGRPDKAAILERVEYYNKLSEPFVLPEEAMELHSLSLKNARTMYYLDSRRIVRWFPGTFRWLTAFGDLNRIVPQPSITKSRPILGDNQNNVLLKLNRFRHFNFLKDPYSFAEKKEQAVFRADIGDPEKQNRVDFMQRYFGSSICDCGSIRNMPGLPPEWLTPKIPIGKLLQYKYILALEGNDVATNLKWIMSSNSAPVMPQPTCETWFMEGTLIPDYHYIEIKPDFSDLEERLRYFGQYPAKAEQIIANAHRYIEPFKDERREDLIALLVMEKYFKLSGQIK